MLNKTEEAPSRVQWGLCSLFSFFSLICPWHSLPVSLHNSHIQEQNIPLIGLICNFQRWTLQQAGSSLFDWRSLHPTENCCCMFSVKTNLDRHWCSSWRWCSWLLMLQMWIRNHCCQIFRHGLHSAYKTLLQMFEEPLRDLAADDGLKPRSVWSQLHPAATIISQVWPHFPVASGPNDDE